MYFANADELPERTRGENRDLFHDSEMARTPVSSGARRFSEGTCLIRELSEIFWVADRFRDHESPGMRDQLDCNKR